MVAGNARSQRVATIWSEFHTRNYQEFNVGNVDCSIESAKELCELFKITNYPTFIFMEGKEMYIYRGAKELEALYEFASTSFWRTTKEDTYDIPIRKIVIKEEDMTMWQYFWKKVYDVDGWVDE